MRASAARARITPGVLSSVTALAGSTAGLFRRSVPALTRVAPVRLLAWLSTSVPAPSFCRLPAPLRTASNVTVWPRVLMLPPAAPTTTARLAASVRSAMACRPPPSSVSGAAAAPSRLLLSIASTPALTTVPPAKLLAPPSSVQVPAPCLTRPPLPLIWPAKWLVAPLPPVRSVKALSATSPPATPPPASEPMVSSAPSTRPTPGLLSRLSATPSASAAPPSKRSVPFCTCTGPLKLLLPLRLNWPLPCLTRPPLPLIEPAKRVLVLRPPVLSVKPARSTPPPAAPPPASEPMRPSAANANATPGLLSSITAACGNTAELLSFRVPALTVRLPSKLFAPASCTLPEPRLTRAALPANSPATPRSCDWLSSVPPPAPTLSLRVAARLRSASARSVPPARVSAPLVEPSRLSASIASTP